MSLLPQIRVRPSRGRGAWLIVLLVTQFFLLRSWDDSRRATGLMLAAAWFVQHPESRARRSA